MELLKTLVVASSFIFTVSMAQAQLYVAPSISDQFAGVTGDDESTGALALNFNFNFFGTTQTAAYMGTNGYLTFGQGANQYFNGSNASPNGAQAISPFFDDLVAPSLSTMTYNNSRTGEFIATWNSVDHYSGPSNVATFQAAIFGVGNRFNLADGTIVLSYENIGNYSNDSVTVGISEGGSSTIAYNGSSDGLINGNTAVRAALQNHQLRYTLNGNSYTVSNISPVPEPETYTMLLSGLGLMGVMVKRRKTT